MSYEKWSLNMQPFLNVCLIFDKTYQCDIILYKNKIVHIYIYIPGSHGRDSSMYDFYNRYI